MCTYSPRESWSGRARPASWRRPTTSGRATWGSEVGERYDLGIEGGTVVTARGSECRQVYVAGGRIGVVTDVRRPAAVCFDASGLLVMPGMVDAHVHFMDPAASD